MADCRETLGEYLNEAEPVAALWPDLVRVVYRDSPRWANLDRLTQAAKTLFNTGCFAGEVVNGGISQFFSNSSGDQANETLDSLRRIDAKLCVELLEKALSLFPNGRAPEDRQLRCELLFAFEDSDPNFLEDLTQVFYKRVDALGAVPEEDLTALELTFMRAHQGERITNFDVF